MLCCQPVWPCRFVVRSASPVGPVSPHIEVRPLSRVCSHVTLRELLEMRRIHEPNLPRLSERVVPRPAVAHDTSNEPEGADPDGGRAVDEHRTVRRIVAEPEKLGYLLVAAIRVDD